MLRFSSYKIIYYDMHYLINNFFLIIIYKIIASLQNFFSFLHIFCLKRVIFFVLFFCLLLLKFEYTSLLKYINNFLREKNLLEIASKSRQITKPFYLRNFTLKRISQYNVKPP